MLVAHLGHDRSGHDRVENGRERRRAEAKAPRLILVDPQLKLARWLDPIEVDLLGLRVRGDDLGQLHGDGADLADVRAGDAVLQRPADGRSEFQGVDPPDQVRELVGQHRFQLHLKPFPGGHVLCDDHGLAEEIVRKLDIQRKIEADRAAPDIGAPSLDIGIVLQGGVEPADEFLAREDRSVLRHCQVDQKLRAVGRREELTRHQRKGQQRGDEQADADGNGEPAGA